MLPLTKTSKRSLVMFRLGTERFTRRVLPVFKGLGLTSASLMREEAKLLHAFSREVLIRLSLELIFNLHAFPL